MKKPNSPQKTYLQELVEQIAASPIDENNRLVIIVEEGMPATVVEYGVDVTLYQQNSTLTQLVCIAMGPQVAQQLMK